MKAKEYFDNGRQLIAGQRWSFDNTEIAYVAEIDSDTSQFKVVTVMKNNPANGWLGLGFTKKHTSLLNGGPYWTFLPGQEAPNS